MTNKQKSLVVIIGGVIALAGLVAGVWGFIQGVQNTSAPTEEVSATLVSAFQEELINRALARGPHPIEGFDAALLLDAFPGLEPADFNNVPTGGFGEEGRYAYRNSELQWNRTTNGSISSAEKTVTQVGYGVLLTNIAARLNKPIATPAQLTALVNVIDIPQDIAEHIASKTNRITVHSPKPLATVASPIAVYGEARGSWFFEATFPITLTDWDGKIIAESYASAVLDPNDPNSTWMTEEFVPFEGTVTFTNPAFPGTSADHFSHRGTLIFHKSNASGLPEHDDALEIPVRFE